MNELPSVLNRAKIRSTIYLYGPPGSGKTSVGKQLASDLGLSFHDLDTLIEKKVGHTIREIFRLEGETGFRAHETQALRQISELQSAVVALGGGSLLDMDNRVFVEKRGIVICLRATQNMIQGRLEGDQNLRPLLSGSDEAKLKNLLSDRQAHYDSFQFRIDADTSVKDIAWRIQVLIGRFYITGMGNGYRVEIEPGGINWLGQRMNDMGLRGPVVVVSDSNVAPIYAQATLNSLRSGGYTAYLHTIPAGERSKNIPSIVTVWTKLLSKSLERGSTVVALGGGVIGDLAGFAASTYLRGINWVSVPTSVLAIVDASLGGKTGVDMPEGKNLVGSFYPPRYVLVDPNVLRTLPTSEINNGMAEVIKHGIIADPWLFSLCRSGWANAIELQSEIIRRAMAVKIKIILADPFEHGVRAALNLGHTLGHGIEKASNYQVRHGEAVSIGIVAAARYAEKIGLSEPGLGAEIEEVLSSFELMTNLPQNISTSQIMEAMKLDKKRKLGGVQLVLPVRIGEVRYGIPLEDLGELVASARR